jgi:hypothetical protein
MGHRAYIAYEQENGTFSMHYSHWGASDFVLCERITEANPLGGPNDLEPKFLNAFTKMLDGMADENDMELAGEIVEKQNEKCVEPEPIKQFIQFEDVIKTIGDKSGIETLYVVEQDYTVHAYRVQTLRIHGENFGNILIRPRDRHGDTDKPYSAKYERGFIAGVQKQLTPLVEQGILTTEKAKEEAVDCIIDWAANRSNRILAHSTAIPNDVLQDNPRAFLDTTSAHRYFGEMIPVQYGDINTWAIPDEINVPPAFSRVEDEICVDLDSNGEQTTDEQTTLTDLTEEDDGNDVTVLPDPTSCVDELPVVNADPDKYKYDRKRVAFTVNDVPLSFTDIPMGLRDKLEQYKKFSRAFNTGLTNVYECNDCRDRNDTYEYGYLTDSENTDSYRNQYTCSYSWRTVTTPRTLHIGGEHAPETWVVDTAFEDGDDTKSLKELPDKPTYTVTISEMEAFRGEDGVIESTTVTISPPDECDLPSSGVIESYPSKSVTDETNGKQWELTARFGESTLQIEWERVENGDCIKYKYRDPDKKGHSKEFIGVTPVEVDTEENVIVDRLTAKATTHTRERTCGGSDFTKVWPPNDLQQRTVSVPDVESADVPNSAQHLSRIQSGLESPVTKNEVETLISFAAYQLQETYNVYGEFCREESTDEDAASSNESCSEHTVNS